MCLTDIEDVRQEIDYQPETTTVTTTTIQILG